MAGDGAAFRQALLRVGARFGTTVKARARLAEYAANWRPSRSVRSVSQTGWYGETFLTHDKQYGGTDEVVFQGKLRDSTRMRAAGTRDGWRRTIAAACVGNSRLVLAVSMAFAGPILFLVKDESGGINVRGDSSQGKTTLLHVARSVWGLQHRTWRQTANGLEATAAALNDLFIPLDEIGEADPRDLPAMVYMHANGISKARMTSAGALREQLQWRALFLSTGEITLATALASVGIKVRAGQEVRLLDLEADAGAGMGVFENIHDAEGAAEFADQLKAVADRDCGHAGRAFIEEVVKDIPGYTKELTEARDKFVETYAKKGCPRDTDGQVTRACTRFALIAAAGELATKLGITGWEEGDAEEAAARCFNDWLGNRPAGHGSAENAQAIAQVRLFIEQHGESRFATPWERETTCVLPEGEETKVMKPDRPTINRAGFRQRSNDGGWVYFVYPETWKAEVCRSIDETKAARALAERGWLDRGEGRNLARNERVPGEGDKPIRLYVINSKFMSES